MRGALSEYGRNRASPLLPKSCRYYQALNPRQALTGSPSFLASFKLLASLMTLIRSFCPIDQENICASLPYLITSCIDRIKDKLLSLGIQLVDSVTDATFVVVDLLGLDDHASLEILSDVHRTGCRSMSIWARGNEAFYGPWVEPQRTACWNCCRLRFGDSLQANNSALADDILDTARVVAENVLLAVRHPDIAGYGCVLVDDGETTALHWVVPMPWCELCGGAAHMVATPERPLSQSLSVPEELRALADNRGGILRRLFIFDADSTAPVVPICASASIGPYEAGSNSVPTFNGEGKGATRDSAVRSAIRRGNRAVRRVAMGSLIAHLRCSFRQLQGQAFDPAGWSSTTMLSTRIQIFRSPGLTRTNRSRGSPGTGLIQVKQVFLPALATYLNLPADATTRFGQTTTSGLAAGTTFEDAALRALYELIERDAFMLHWLARMPGELIRDGDSDPIVKLALDGVERLGARTELYLLDPGTNHPTVVCLGLGDGQS